MYTKVIGYVFLHDSFHFFTPGETCTYRDVCSKCLHSGWQYFSYCLCHLSGISCIFNWHLHLTFSSIFFIKHAMYLKLPVLPSPGEYMKSTILGSIDGANLCLWTGPTKLLRFQTFMQWWNQSQLRNGSFLWKTRHVKRAVYASVLMAP